MFSTTAQVLQAAAPAHGIIERYCRALTEATSHLALAWTWFGDATTDVITPQVAAGRSVAWARGLQIERNWLTSRGPAFRALAGDRIEPFSISTLSPWGPWRHAAADEGICTVLCLPLRRGPSGPDAVFQQGILVLYADQPGYFDGLVGFFESVAELFGSILRDAATREALARDALTDALTGIGNRRRLDVLAQDLHAQGSQAAPATVVVIDLDRFKTVNDQFGHAAGDAVLRGTAQLLAGAIRHGDTVLRFGGEEFVVLLPNSTGAQAAIVADALRARLEAHRFALQDGVSLRVTASFGVAELFRGEHLTAALRRADAALYEAKRQGRNQIRVADGRAGESARSGADISWRDDAHGMAHAPTPAVDTAVDARIMLR